MIMNYSKSMVEAFVRDSRDYLLIGRMVKGDDRRDNLTEKLITALNIIDELRNNEEAH